MVYDARPCRSLESISFLDCQTNTNSNNTHNFAKTPLKAAQAPLATAKNIHCDRILILLGEGIVEADSVFKDEGGEGSGSEEAAV